MGIINLTGLNLTIPNLDLSLYCILIAFAKDFVLYQTELVDFMSDATRSLRSFSSDPGAQRALRDLKK